MATAALSPASGEAAPQKQLTVYSVATGVQYINSADDAARGAVNNPFDPAVNKLHPKTSSSGIGPFAGDVVVYAINLYSGKSLKRHAGSGVYTCYFNYDKNAFCDAYYQFPGDDTVVAAGPIDFKKNGFTIVITGGTKKYVGARGEIRVVASGRASQRIEFQVLG
jgi:hypothetical protein